MYLLFLAEAKQELMDVQTQMEHQTEEDESIKGRLQRVMEENIRLGTTKKQLEEDLDDIRDKLTESLLLSSQLSAEVTS